MTDLKEFHIEQAAIEWLEQMGYEHVHGASFTREARTVVLEDVLQNFIAKKYPQLPAEMVKEAAKEFTNNVGADLEYRNRDFHLKLTKGIDISWKQNEKENALHIYPIDFENPENNTFYCVNQLEIVGRNRRIPDLLIYINGLPLIIFEFKNWFDHNTTENEAFNQIQHYKQDIPLLFEYNALTIISDGKTAQHGMFPASMEWFAPWKSVNGKDIVDENDFQLHSLLHGLFGKDRLLNYLKHFIFFEDHNGTLIKKGAKYHQYFGVNFAVEKTKDSIKPIGDGRIGVIWHTQGSGKSISMAIYTGILRQLPELKNPTIVVQVDRNDLDWQLYENFVLCKDIVGEVTHATSTDELRRLLDTDAGGVIFTTIEKFRLKNSSPKGVVRRTEGVGAGEHQAALEKFFKPYLSIIDENGFTKAGFLKYNDKLGDHVKANRYAENLSEVLLWNQLKRDKLGVDFHRQKPIGHYIVDFFCPELMLAIEVDGSVHDSEEAQQRDAKRQKNLEDLGINFLRFSASAVEKLMDSVLLDIKNYIKEHKTEFRLSLVHRGVLNRKPELKGHLPSPPQGGKVDAGEFASELERTSSLCDPSELELTSSLGNELGEIVHPVLSSRDNIIVIADEAHRTQYGLLDGYAANLRTALPNASFIGFTGTPIDKKDADTEELFGEVIHTYDIKQAVEDGATVPIYYEPRLAKLHLANENIDEEVDEITEANSDERFMKWAAIEDAAGSQDRVEKIAADILRHFTNRTETLEGKAMIVCMSRRNCVKMFDAITKLEGCPEVAVIITSNISKDPPEWKEHVRTKDQFETIKKRFKNPDDPLKIVIVRDMWLTGFDAPIINSLYVDKVMTGHNLMQAIARANRVFADKQSGVIVDYIGIGDQLKSATDKYTAGGGRGETKIDIEKALEMFIDQVGKCKSHLPAEIDYSKWRALTSGDKMMLINQGTNAILKTDQLADQFMKDEKVLTGLVSIVKSREELAEYALDVIYVQHISAAVRKAKSIVIGKKDNQKKVRDLISQSIESDQIIDVFAMAGIARPDVSILNEDFLLGAKKDKSGLALKIELMRNILKGEIALRLHKNIRKYNSLKEEIEKVIEQYHKNAIDSYTTILELVERAKEMQEEEKRQKELGISDEELAFYDIIHAKKEIIQEAGPIQNVVHAVCKAVKDNLEIDWTKKEDAKAAIRLAIKRELRGKVDLDQLNKILQEIMEQAEGQFKNWPEVG
ncbi:MAG: HsdR family type I site-specific deoxyribonuclease [Crocinitomicaceae bacterium]|nr:HsdR family type I site-specific deoxyribonuclease [Crocinitomicaceae bacterium]